MPFFQHCSLLFLQVLPYNFLIPIMILINNNKKIYILFISLPSATRKHLRPYTFPSLLMMSMLSAKQLPWKHCRGSGGALSQTTTQIIFIIGQWTCQKSINKILITKGLPQGVTIISKATPNSMKTPTASTKAKLTIYR